MSSVFRKRCIILLPSILALCQIASADSKSITVNDPRPVAEAAEQLEAIYSLPITYEDPPYVHESTIADVTNEVRRDKQQGQTSLSRVLVPKSETISFSYEMPSPSTSPGAGLQESAGDQEVAATQAVSNVLHSYAAVRGAEIFTVVEDSGMIHVVPTHFINPTGKVQELTPILDKTITIAPKQRTGAELVSEICQALSVTGQTVISGTMPFSLLARHETTLGGSGLTARSFLSRLLAEMTVPLSWQLFYDPGLRMYVLNVHVVSGSK